MTPVANSAEQPCQPASRVGIVGGGQLAMLLCSSARDMGIRSIVLTDDATAPAVHSADEVLVAPLDDTGALEELVRRAEVITFELEAVPDPALVLLREAAEFGWVAVNPAVSALARLADKGTQKQWLRDAGLPTLPFRLTDGSGAAEGLATPLVQKLRRGGYDGRGVQILREPDSLARLWRAPSVIEPALDACVEVAVLVARDMAGRQAHYPPVTMEFDPDLNAVSAVTSPGALEPGVADACRGIACDAVAALGAAGVFAVELFVTAAGAVFINEISPRVHNAGHLTIDAFEHDQFEQHLRAVTGRSLAPVVPRAPAAVMLNLLYEDGLASALSTVPYSIPLAAGGCVTLHWYGKREARPGRKMGHITAVGDSAAIARERARDALARLRSGNVSVPQPRLQAAS